MASNLNRIIFGHFSSHYQFSFVSSIIVMLAYRKSDLLIDASIIAVALFTTFILRYTLLFEDNLLSLFFRCIIYLIDISIFTAIFVSLEGRGSIIVFYIYRFIQLVYSDTFDINDSVIIAILGYIFFKSGCLLVNKKLGLCEIDQEIKKIDDSTNTLQQKRRFLCLLLLGISSFMVIGLSTSNQYQWTAALTTCISLMIGLGEILLTLKGQSHQVKIIYSTIHYNLYMLIGINAIMGYINHASFLYHAEPLVIYLVLTFFILRLLVGAQSFRFHRDDKELFSFIYPFSHQKIYKKYINNDQHNLLPKAIDKLSRKIVLIVYLLSAALATQGQGYLWLPISALLLNNYKIENNLENPLSFIDRKLKIKLRANIILPLVFLAVSELRKQPCFKDTIFDMVSGCGNYISWQNLYTIALPFLAMVSQFISERWIKLKLQKGVAFASPILLFLFIIGLECQTIKSLLMTIYSLSLCIQIIKDDRIGAVKGNKRQ